jgi:hypothetical protein
VRLVCAKHPPTPAELLQQLKDEVGPMTLEVASEIHVLGSIFSEAEQLHEPITPRIADRIACAALCRSGCRKGRTGGAAKLALAFLALALAACDPIEIDHGCRHDSDVVTYAAEDALYCVEHEELLYCQPLSLARKDHAK